MISVSGEHRFAKYCRHGQSGGLLARLVMDYKRFRKHRTLQPSIVLLDVGMPGLNGIEAAGIIHQKCPKSKILFVTQDSDSDIRDAAMRTGATGYVRKANAGSDLLGAISTALSG